MDFPWMECVACPGGGMGPRLRSVVSLVARALAHAPSDSLDGQSTALSARMYPQHVTVLESCGKRRRQIVGQVGVHGMCEASGPSMSHVPLPCHITRKPCIPRCKSSVPLMSCGRKSDGRSISQKTVICCWPRVRRPMGDCRWTSRHSDVSSLLGCHTKMQYTIRGDAADYCTRKCPRTTQATDLHVSVVVDHDSTKVSNGG